MADRNTVGKKVQLFREMRNLSVEEVSKRSGLCVEEISTIENGEQIGRAHV